MNKLFKFLLPALALFSININTVQADTYEITITNLTRGQIFSPVFAISHRRHESLFSLGYPVSEELAALAQDADNTGLNALYSASSKVTEVVEGTGVIHPGDSETITIHGRRHRDVISLAGMLVSSNDAFYAANKLRLPRSSSTVLVPVYDAGAEDNDESCAYIPGPPCGNEKLASDIAGEGYVHIHAGIHGIGGLTPAIHDWRNPAAKITIKRIKSHYYK